MFFLALQVEIDDPFASLIGTIVGEYEVLEGGIEYSVADGEDSVVYRILVKNRRTGRRQTWMKPVRSRRVIDTEVRVCTAKSCCKRGSNELLANLSASVADNVNVRPSGCLGKCKSCPAVEIVESGSKVTLVNANFEKVLACISPDLIAHSRGQPLHL